MKIFKIWSNNASERQLEEISAVINDGELVIIPTDTAYAIACDALNPKAVERLCRLKGINPEKTNLSVICPSISMAAEYAKISNSDFMLLKENTPGAFTFLFRASSKLPKAFKGRKVVGIRIPDNSLTRDIVEAVGHPVLSTTIEYVDEDYAVNPELIAEAYENKVDAMVDGGDGSTRQSTVVDCTSGSPEIIREGAGELME